jgi:hypothetical protein
MDHRLVIAALGVAAIALTPEVHAQQTRTFSCSFPTYSNAEGLQRERGGLSLTFLIDLNTRKAYVIGNNGSEEVRLIPNNAGFTLLEVTGTGNVATTTIAFEGSAVHSRNMLITSNLIPSQYYGRCTVRQ